MIQKYVLFIALVTGLALPSVAEEEFHLFQLSLFNPVQLHPEEDSVSFLRLNLIYGVNEIVEGFDIGLFNHTTGYMEGLAIGLYNRVEDHSDSLQIGLVNRVDGEFHHYQVGLLNHAGVNSSGQVGLVNCANSMQDAFQFGLINYTGEFISTGIQIGLINISRAGPRKFFPIVNWQW